MIYVYVYGFMESKARHLSLSSATLIHDLPLYFLKIHFNIILPYTFRSSTGSFFRVSTLYALIFIAHTYRIHRLSVSP